MFRTLALISALLFSLSGALAELPEPENNGVNMIIGDKSGDYYAEVELYYESDSGVELSSITRTVYVPAGGSLAETALAELFSSAGDQEHASPMPGDATLCSIELAGSLATVEVIVDMAGLQDDSELVAMFNAITNTLTGIDGVEAVNILVNSAPESVCGIPAGVLEHNDSSTAVAWSRYQAEAAGFLNNGQMALTRRVALYFPSTNGQWLLPEVREVSFQNEEYASQLMLELISGTNAGNAYANFLSGGASIMTADPEISISSAGERVLEVYLSSTIRDYMLLQGLSEWQLAGAITVTMCSFISGLDAVRVNIDGTPITRLNIRGQNKDFETGLMRRSDFSMYIGSVGSLYFGDGNGGLIEVGRAMSSKRAQSAYSLVTQLISGPSSADQGAQQTMPVGVSAGDLLGVSVTDDVAVVNFSANFYRLCQNMDADGERLLVYSIVNTLCGRPGISAVRIVVEGEQVEALSDSIYLKGELLPNPGIVK